MEVRIILLIISTTLIGSLNGTAQYILNGSFENNTIEDSCLINMEEELITIVENVYDIDTFYQFIDLIFNDCSDFTWGVTSNGSDFLGLSINTLPGGGGKVIEKIALEISVPLIFGEEYTLVYYYKAGNGLPKIEIGVSNTSSSFGIAIDSSQTSSTNLGSWVKKEINFISPIEDALFVTAQLKDEGLGNWLLIDGFALQLTTSLNDKSEDTCCEIYPNPTPNDFFYIESEDAINFSIYDIYGRLIDVQKVEDKTLIHTIRLSNIDSGIYLIRIDFDNGKYKLKHFIKMD